MKSFAEEKAFVAECEAAARAGVLHGTVLAAGTAESLDVLWAWGDASVTPARKAMRTDSVFDVASVTKAVATTSACAVCIDRGLLNADASAASYLPKLGQFPGSDIRVCDLAMHCSGYDNRKFDPLPPDRFDVEIVETPAQWPARQRFEYSCRNFIVLGRIVEEVTGQDLAAFCKRNVFEPSGMDHSRFGPLAEGLDNVVPSSSPAGIISDEQARSVGHPVGNAGLFSNAGDLARFCQMLLRGGRVGDRRVLQAESMKWIMQPCNPPNLPRRAFGWDMRTRAECHHRPRGVSAAAIGHSGWTGQSVWIDPTPGLFVIAMTNRTHAPGNPDNYELSAQFRARVGDMLIALMQKRA